MTNEEAREQLKDISRSFSETYFGKWREALDLAIKALEQLQDVHDTCKNCIEFSEFEQQPRWIPVSEKPQEGRYLCTYEHYDGRCIDFGSFDGEVWYIKPIAYMPLPEPYKEGDNNEI